MGYTSALIVVIIIIIIIIPNLKSSASNIVKMKGNFFKKNKINENQKPHFWQTDFIIYSFITYTAALM